jgi:hypothetical protein
MSRRPNHADRRAAQAAHAKTISAAASVAAVEIV